MKPGVPWSVKGIEPEARVAAKKAAQQAGMTLGQWLNRVILTSGPESPGIDAENWSPPASKSDQDLATLHAALADMARRFDEVEQHNQEIITHLDRAADDAQNGDLAPIQGSTVEARLIARLEETKQELFGRMEALESGLNRPPDSATLKPLAGTLSKIVQHLETSEKRNIDGMGAMEQAIAHLAQRMDSTERRAGVPGDAHENLSELEARIKRVEREARENADAIRERVYEISHALQESKPARGADTDDLPADYITALRFEALEASLKDLERKISGIEVSAAHLVQQIPTGPLPTDGITSPSPADINEAKPSNSLAETLIRPFGTRRRKDTAGLDLPPVQKVPVPKPPLEEGAGEDAPPPAAEPEAKIQESAKAPSPPLEMDKTARVKNPIADLVLDDEDDAEEHTTKGRFRRGVMGAILLSFILMAGAAVLLLLGDGRFSISDALTKLDLTGAMDSLSADTPEKTGQNTVTAPPTAPADPIAITVTPTPQAATPAAKTNAAKTDPDQQLLLADAPVPIEDLERLSAAGRAWAHYRLGLRFLRGKDVALDEQRGGQLIKQAALQDLAAAQYRLGALYEAGLGFEQDFVQARLWYAKAAFAGNRKAMYNLGVLYAEGSGIAQDYARAHDWFTKAARLGLADGQFNLAMLLYKGIGGARDPIQAYKWFAIAAKHGDSGAAEMKTKLESELDASSLASARALVSIWQPQPLDRLVNLEF